MIGMLGILMLLVIAYLLSSKRSAINLRTVGTAFVLQAGFAAFVLYVPWGQNSLAAMSNVVSSLEDSATKGIDFLFGGLNSAKMFDLFGGGGFVFAIKVLPVIVFFSAFIAVLYYLRVMDVIISVIGGALQRAMGTSRTESLSATANIFLGQTEAPLVVRPYIPHMTRSELFSVMVCGLASTAGSVMIGYASLGVDLKYLIAASLMSAPGGMLMAKLMEPEDETPQDRPELIEGYADDRPANVLDAAAAGASSGLQLALNVGAMLLVFIALVAVLNSLMGWLGGFVGYPGVTLQLLLGYAFAPVAWLLGVPWAEAIQAGGFIGQKIVLNEFVAYVDFARYINPIQASAAGVEVLSAHTQVIVTFALCGFANLSSIGILLGGMGVMAPNRRKDLARLGVRAMIAGTLANLMSAALAGLFVSL